ncbi:MAG: HAMP domain-containing histidine kinase [Clostridiales bacterium]|nr:HAMP domain-containing histidine kinase [Clostridiales bacterium]
MRFSLKICLGAVMIVAILFAIAGQVWVADTFDANLDYRVEAVLANYSSLASALNAEVYGLTLTYNAVTPAMLQEALERAAEVQMPGTPCALYRSDGVLLAAKGGSFPSELSFPELPELLELAVRRFAYRLERKGDGAQLETAGTVSIGGYAYFLALRLPADDLLANRRATVRSATLLHISAIALCVSWMLLFSARVMRNVRRVLSATRRIRKGQLTARAKADTLDEIGDLAVGFNSMAESIEQKVADLQANAKQQKDFVANFSHELKTPLTSIIGYADMLRSAQMEEEDAFMAANFIYSEGKRLEALALKLMDLVVLDKSDYKMMQGYAKHLFGHASAVVTPMLEKAGLSFEAAAEQRLISYEKDLLIMLITNLVDNARKASEPGRRVLLTGRQIGDRYRITVQDFGRGIPPEDLSRLTEAFFMVDKSRARAQHGAGLGLAIGQKIARLHGDDLHFESEVDVGTSVWFTVPLLSATAPQGDTDEDSWEEDEV